MEEELIINIDKLHTTKMGLERISKNLHLDNNINVISLLKEKIKTKKSKITKSGKNFYVTTSDCVLTIHAKSYTVITAHKSSNKTKNKEIIEYFKLLCNNDYPDFIDKYIKTKEMQRLKNIGQFCGCDYTSIYNVKYWYSRLDHSIATSLMTWNFTKDKTQTLCALFHDLGTPAFSHCIDFLLNDHINQESSELDVYKILQGSSKIKKMLSYDNVNIEDLKTPERYTIVENKKPKLCVDRLEGVLHTCLIWLPYWNLETITKIYQNIHVLTNEYNEKEIGFYDMEIAELFFEGIHVYSIGLQKNEDKFTLQFIADNIKYLIDNKIIELNDLYFLTEHEIIKLFESNCSKRWELFIKAKNIERSYHFIPNMYLVTAEVKKRLVIPVIEMNGKITRLNEISNICNNLLNEYENFKDSKYSYISGIDAIN